jgi:hypothetical protein
MPDSLVETLWNIIQKLLPSDGRPAAAAGPSPFAPKPGVKYGGLVVPDSRDRVKELEQEILAEGQAKRDAERQQQAAAAAAAAVPHDRERDGRDGRDGERRRDERDRDRDRDRGRDGDRDRDKDRRR